MRQLKITKSITNRESASFEKYLQEIGKEELLTASDEVELAKKIRMGDASAKERLVRGNLRFVVSVAKQYQSQGLSLPDLINEGNLGLIKAAGRFDETRGFKFISYAVWWIRQTIMQSLAEQARIVRLPLNQIGNANRATKIIGKLEQELEREPTNQEIIEASKETPRGPISEATLKEVMPAYTHAKSLDSKAFNSEDSVTLMETIEDESIVSPDQYLVNNSVTYMIEKALETLPERERDVVKMFYGLGFENGMSLEEIGEKFNLTRERVRQIKEKAIRTLRVGRKYTLLRQFLDTFQT